MPNGIRKNVFEWSVEDAVKLAFKILFHDFCEHPCPFTIEFELIVLIGVVEINDYVVDRK